MSIEHAPIRRTRNEVARRYRVTPLTISRWTDPNSTQFRPDFPRPLCVGRYKLWDDSTLDRYDAQLMGQEVAHAS